MSRYYTEKNYQVAHEAGLKSSIKRDANGTFTLTLSGLTAAQFEDLRYIMTTTAVPTWKHAMAVRQSIEEAYWTASERTRKAL